MRIALSAAETGHLVFSTVHTTDVASTVSRVSDSFPTERQGTIRQELAMALAAVLTQTLLPRRGGGQVPAVEMLVVGYGARQHIRKNALQHLHQEIALTRRNGSVTLEESLARLVAECAVERKKRARGPRTEESSRACDRPLDQPLISRRKAPGSEFRQLRRMSRGDPPGYAVEAGRREGDRFRRPSTLP